MFTTYITSSLDTLIQYPKSAQCVIYWLFFLSSFVGIGAVIPGALLLFMLGTLVSTNKLNLVTTIFSCVLGSMTGSLSSFGIGYYYQTRLKETWLFRTYPILLNQGEMFFKYFGEIGIVIGKFTGPTRAILPIVAGITGMNPYQFILVDTIATIFWPLVYILPSTYFMQYFSSWAMYPNVYYAIFTTIFMIFFYVMRQQISQIFKAFIILLKQAMNLQESDLPRQYFQRYYTVKPFHYSLLPIAFVSGTLSGLLALNVKMQGITTTWNILVHTSLQNQRSLLWDKFFVGMSLINAKTIGYVWVTVTLWLVWRKEFWRVVHWVVLGISVYSTTEILKYGLNISRPSGILKPSLRNAFPSGHVMHNMTIIYAYIKLLDLTPYSFWLKTFIYTIYLVWVILMAFCRLYLGAHWLTDVMGAILISLTYMTLFDFSYSRYTRPLYQKTSLLSLTSFVLVLSWLFRLMNKYQKLLIYHTPI